MSVLLIHSVPHIAIATQKARLPDLFNTHKKTIRESGDEVTDPGVVNNYSNH